MNQRREDAVLTPQKQREEIPRVKRPSVSRHFIKLATQGWCLAFPNRFGADDVACWEVFAEPVVKKFHLSACIQTGLGAIAGPCSIGCCQLVGKGHDGDIGGSAGLWKAEKRPLLKVR